jgi:hypothetical protein
VILVAQLLGFFLWGTCSLSLGMKCCIYTPFETEPLEKSGSRLSGLMKSPAYSKHAANNLGIYREQFP